ncbi:MAG TPA: tetratricopeptide repeat protein [Lichenihabitans sp.]|jgi:predicted O-linked N-acetylglucosamine transferase (SPINDLY family)|nr:tetratricopeptide repeat protein [Lichenihabitans sp.]
MKQRQGSAPARRLVLQSPRQAKAAAHGAYANGVGAMVAGQKATAAAFYESAISLDPAHGEAHHGLAVLAAQDGRPAEALSLLERTIALLPDHAEARANLCVLLSRTGRHAEAIASGRKAVAIKPSYAGGHAKLAGAYDVAGDDEAAIAAYRTAIALSPKSSDVHFLLAEVLRRVGRLDDAFQACRDGLAIDPKRPEGHNTLGILYQQSGYTKEAFEAYFQAVTLKPDYALAHINLCAVLCKIARFKEAEVSGHIATRLLPDSSAASINHAMALRYTGRLPEAIEAYRRALAIDPQRGELLIDIANTRQYICDWSGLEAEQDLAARVSYRVGKPVSPFSILTSSPSPVDHLDCARVWASALTLEPLEDLADPPRSSEPRRLRVGYLSADFYQHATTTLIAELLELHDRSRFELFGYSIGHNDGSAMRQRIAGSFDKFVDLRTEGDRQAARLIKRDRLDILIDLKGYTDGARTQILAHRPAPVQVNYLGYPGTMGASFIDYIVADPVVAPFEHAAHFDERIVHLPHCYQPNDNRRAIAAVPSRAECGLPEDGFVFCCFNNPYKFTSQIFAVWMRLLRDAPKSVLWLFQPNTYVADNLRGEATAAGVDAGRIVFAPLVPSQHHIARMTLADLFLDTLPVNAHTTASEALWAGLPVLTCLGDAFVSRVAASLLDAVGLPDLATTSLAGYEALALALAHDGPRLAALKARLLANRATSPLFDTARYTRNFEAALVHMAGLDADGRPPESFAVKEP